MLLSSKCQVCNLSTHPPGSAPEAARQGLKKYKANYKLEQMPPEVCNNDGVCVCVHMYVCMTLS